MPVGWIAAALQYAASKAHQQRNCHTAQHLHESSLLLPKIILNPPRGSPIAAMSQNFAPYQDETVSQTTDPAQHRHTERPVTPLKPVISK
jgi:hypothetical protein